MLTRKEGPDKVKVVIGIRLELTTRACHRGYPRAYTPPPHLPYLNGLNLGKFPRNPRASVSCDVRPARPISRTGHSAYLPILVSTSLLVCPRTPYSVATCLRDQTRLHVECFLNLLAESLPGTVHQLWNRTCRLGHGMNRIGFAPDR